MSDVNYTYRRRTSETDAQVEICWDSGPAPFTPAPELRIRTGFPFLDHMLSALKFNARSSLEGFGIAIKGDTEVDDHHTVEDCAIALGEALRLSLYERAAAKDFAIARYGVAFIPMDDALARVAVDLGGRPYSDVSLGLKREAIGGIASENFVHFFGSLAQSLRAAIHIDVLKGSNDHHRIEAAFKALGRALAEAAKIETVFQGGWMPSTKGEVNYEL